MKDPTHIPTPTRPPAPIQRIDFGPPKCGRPAGEKCKPIPPWFAEWLYPVWWKYPDWTPERCEAGERCELSVRPQDHVEETTDPDG